MSHQIDPKAVLNVYALLARTRSLGPHTRFALWTQGCSLGCAGCMSQNSHDHHAGFEMHVEALASRILETSGIEGITLSGGEPFEQAGVLWRLLERLKAQGDLGVLCFSGYAYTRLRTMAAQNLDVARMLGCIDTLIAGPYVAYLNDGVGLRGSSNQSIHHLSSRYAQVDPSYFTCKPRESEIYLFEQEAMIVGIPGAQTLQQWQTIKSISTTGAVQ